MRTDKLQTIQISETTLQWLKANYIAVDSKDADRYRQFLAPDCKLAFGNNPVVQCNNDIVGGIKHFWETIQGLDHSFISVIGNDFHFAAEALIDYKRLDGRVVSVPCTTIIVRNAEGLASFVKIFIDLAPVYQN